MTAIEPAPVPLVIVGAGGFGREVLELVRDVNAVSPSYDVLGFLDDGEIADGFLERLGSRLLGTSDQLGNIPATIVIAIGAPGPRRQVDLLASAASRPAATLVHPSATIGRDVVLGEGVIVGAGTRVTTNVTLGRHAHVNVNCTIGHDAVLEAFVTVFPGVHISGGCIVEDGATLGTGCVLIPGVRIGHDSVVGAGAVVTRDVPPGATVVGAAARPTLSPRSGGGAAGPE